MSRPFALLSSVALVCLVPACDSQVDGEHQGTVLATIQGSLETHRVSPLPQPEVALVWAQASQMGKLVEAERVSAEGLFPQFKLSIYTPPPDDALDALDGDRFGVGLVVVGTPDTDYTARTGWKGVELQHVVMYLPAEPAEGSTLGGFLHGANTKGFHIFDVKRLTEPERQQRLACVNAIPHNGGMLTQHEIFTQCGGAGNDELTRSATDLDTLLDVAIVEDTGIVDLINSLPHW
jgi:hypothetical protein